jgi:hypothetical protein
MIMDKTKRSPTEKVRVFGSLFTGLRNVYGTYDLKTGKVRQEKETVTDEVIRAHLTGKQPYGVYLLTGHTISALAVDFDEDQLHLPVSFVAAIKQYGIPAYIERSKSKGYHVWVFFEQGGVSARKARRVAHKVLADLGRPKTEVFPKQDALTSEVSYGNFINAPLFGALVPKGRTVFVDPSDPTRAYPDQWDLLAGVQRVPESVLDVVIAGCELSKQAPVTKRPECKVSTRSDADIAPYGLAPCARQMLSQGVTSYQRVSCFRLAVQLKRNGMPLDLALVVLKAWAKKNRPADGKGAITDREIEGQTRCAFEKTYRSFGCEDPAVSEFCSPDCILRRRRGQ